MWEAKPGMKVVCIKKGEEWEGSGFIYPVVGETYTITDVNPCSDDKIYNGLLLDFEEIPEQLTNNNNIISFEVDCFRPLVSNKGMEVLQKILKNPNKKISGFEQSKTKVKQGA